MKIHKSIFLVALTLIGMTMSCEKDASETSNGPQQLVSIEKCYYEDLVVEHRSKNEYAYTDSLMSHSTSYNYSNGEWVAGGTYSIDYYYPDSIVMGNESSKNVYKLHDGHCIQVVSWSKNSSAWRFSSKVDYTYLGDDCIRYESFDYNTSSRIWMPFEKYEYDCSGGQVNSFIHYEYANGAYIEIEKITNTISNGHIIEILRQNHENSTTWVNFEKTVNIYSGDKITKSELYTYRNNEEWHLYTYTDYTYNNAGNLSEASTYMNLELDEKPALSYKCIYTYEAGTGNWEYLLQSLGVVQM